MAFKTSDLSEHMGKVAEKWGDLLPLVVGKWRHFESENLENEFIEALQWVVKWILEWATIEKNMQLSVFGISYFR